jgi:hypothetical protein
VLGRDEINGTAAWLGRRAGVRDEGLSDNEDSWKSSWNDKMKCSGICFSGTGTRRTGATVELVGRDNESVDASAGQERNKGQQFEKLRWGGGRS